MPTTDPFTLIATALKQIIETEFAAEAFTVVFDNLHESLGRTRVDIGVAPIADEVRASNKVVQETSVELKFYDLWPQQISPETVVNPSRITGFAHRFREALRNARGFTDPQTGEVWFFSLERIAYPNDPTGNKTRFVATIRGLGNNNALVETTA